MWAQKYFTLQEFKKALAELKNAQAAGVDNIPEELLKAFGKWR